MIGEIDRLIKSFNEPLGQSIQEATERAFLGGAQQTTGKLPRKVRQRLDNLPNVGTIPPKTPKFTFLGVAEADPEPFFPGIVKAAEKLIESKTLTPADYYALSAEAKKQAFTISGEITQATVEKVRTILAEQMSETGVSLDAFEQAVDERIGELPINAAHLEQVYRNAVNSAYSEGQEHVLSGGIVLDEFPYRAYYAIHDARARHDHLALEKFGLNGTNVYLATDPFWSKYRPPIFFSCRCSWAGISIEQAAAEGVKHAKEWLANIDAAKENGAFDGWNEHYMPPVEYVNPPADKLPPTWND